MRAPDHGRPHPSRRAHARSTLRKRLRMRAPQDEDEHRVSVQLTMSNSPDLLVPAAHLRPGFCILASLTPSRGVGGAPIRRPYILTSPQTAPDCFKRLPFFPCAFLRLHLPSSGSIALSRDRDQGG